MIPNVSNAVRRFEETLQFQIVKKTVTDGDLAETSKVPVVLWFEGTLQPLAPSKLLVKPEGQRGFQWWTLYTDLVLELDQVIKDNEGRIFRVMNNTEWADAGYNAYELIQGPGL